MKTIMALTAGAALLALPACSRSNDGGNQTGTAKGGTGLQVNAISTANECMSASDMARPLADISPEERIRMISCLNAATARQINTQLPRQAGEDMRLDRLTTEGPLLTYHYTVTRPASELPAQFGQQLEATQRRMVCAQPQARQTIGFGGVYGFRWVDSQGQLIHETRIDAC